MTTDASADELRDALLTVTPAQQRAAEALANGATHADAAEAAGVRRECVCRWANHHAGFKALVASYRHALWVEQTDQRRALLGRALDVVAAHLDGPEPDPRYALDVLRWVPDPGAPSPLTAAELRDADRTRLRANAPPAPPVEDVTTRALARLDGRASPADE